MRDKIHRASKTGDGPMRFLVGSYALNHESKKYHKRVKLGKQSFQTLQLNGALEVESDMDWER